MTRYLRIAAGIVILAGLAVIAATLTPCYVRNWRFERSLTRAAAEAGDEAQLRAGAYARAQVLGIPIRPNQIQVLRVGPHLRVEVPYEVGIELPLYSIALHFHPAAVR